MTARAAVLRGRFAAAALRADTGTITRPGEDTFNPGTGLIDPGTPTTIYDGPLRVRQPTAMESEALFGEEQITRTRFMVDVPHDTTGVKVNDVANVTTSDDVDILTRTFRITAIPMSTFVISKSFPAEAIE